MSLEAGDEDSEEDDGAADNEFEEFAEGAHMDDFGDFDEGFQDPEESRAKEPLQPSLSGPPLFVSA